MLPGGEYLALYTMADAMFYVVVLVVIYVLVRILHSNSNAEKPRLFHKDSKLVREILKMCPTILDVYTPTYLWGKSGHFQTFVYAKLGRVQPPFLKGYRRSVLMSDGATCTFDVFQPTEPHPTQGDTIQRVKGDFTICIAPGIANSSESKYIRTFVNYACSHGYRVGVLNHLGALKSVPLTSPRIFTYGDTEEYSAMVTYFEEKYPGTHFVAVGFSMGGNIVLKYLGEDTARQQKFVCGVSLCQGYDLPCGIDAMHQWERLRRIYNFLMTENQKSVIKRNRDMLFGAGAKAYFQREGRRPPDYDLDKVFEATSLVHIDEHFTRKMAGFSSLEEFLLSSSSSVYMPNVQIPVLILNAEDDPLITPAVFKFPMKHVQTVDNAIFAVTKHGGHLGFFEGGVVLPNSLPWLDRVVMEYVNAVIEISQREDELSD